MMYVKHKDKIFAIEILKCQYCGFGWIVPIGPDWTYDGRIGKIIRTFEICEVPIDGVHSRGGHWWVRHDCGDLYYVPKQLRDIMDIRHSYIAIGEEFIRLSGYGCPLEKDCTEEIKVIDKNWTRLFTEERGGYWEVTLGRLVKIEPKIVVPIYYGHAKYCQALKAKLTRNFEVARRFGLRAIGESFVRQANLRIFRSPLFATEVDSDWNWFVIGNHFVAFDEDVRIGKRLVLRTEFGDYGIVPFQVNKKKIYGRIHHPEHGEIRDIEFPFGWYCAVHSPVAAAD